MDDKEKTQFERDVGRTYNREFAPAVVAYVVVTAAISILIDFETAGRWKYAAALIPVAPALWGVRAIARHLSRIDEMGRGVHLAAMSVGFGIAMMTAITLGFLAMAGLDSNNWGPWAIYSAGMAGWAFTSVRRGAFA